MNRAESRRKEARGLMAAACMVVAGAFIGLTAWNEGVSGEFVQTEQQAQPARPGELGFTDTPRLPNLPWHVHDPARPHPPVVTAGSTPGTPPSDAEVLFDGKDLSKWVHRQKDGQMAEPKWIVRDGYFEVAPRSGTLSTRESFGDVQLHLEWAAPAVVAGRSQGRGNSGVLLMGLYEIQVLDSYENPTYADGMAGAMYGQWPPLVNAARKPGEWQTYDIVFDAPRFENGKIARAASVTVFWNGIVVHNRQESMGQTVYRDVAKYSPHAAELPLTLQDHGNPVRFRNIWIRRLGPYDAAASRTPDAAAGRGIAN